MLNVAVLCKRIVVIVVDTWRDDDDKLQQYVVRLPVVAIETVADATQSRREMIVAYDRFEEGVLISVGELVKEACFSVRVVVCEWPECEDESRLQPLIEELVDQAALREGGRP
jgi:predicted regulator of amino acid metabolism with ACT domain